MRLWAQVLLDLLLPPHCPSCGEQVATQGTFCAACFGKLSFITAPLCTGCGLPFASRAFAGPLQLCPASRRPGARPEQACSTTMPRVA
jgi:predicted amidophosphoribosyltransferase